MATSPPRQSLNQHQLPESPLDRTNAPRAPDAAPLAERHQAALCHMQTLEAHNTKLYQDNCRLVTSVNILNERLAFAAAPRDAQVFRFSVIQERLRASDENRALIDRKYQDLLQSVSAGSAHHHIYIELQAARDAHASLDRDYRLLRDKYIKLKAVVNTTHIPQQHPGLVPVIPSDFHPPHQTLNNSAPPSAMPPGPFHSSSNQKGNQRRRSSESAMTQPSLRSGPISVPPAWSASLPTPPPSATLPGSQLSPIGFPVHAPVPARSLPLPNNSQMFHDPSTLSGFPAVIQSQCPPKQDLSDQLKTAVYARRRSEQKIEAANKEPAQCGEQIAGAAPLELSPRSLKRPNSDPQSSPSQGGEYKKPRTEGESVHATTINADADPVNQHLPLPDSNDPHSNQTVSELGPDVRSYQDCVNLIFEKDADIENGVFCGLCFNRYRAKMVPEPPEVLIEPELDLLLTHCMKMHPAIWDDLCRSA